eukprot:4969659-Pyramimonas_sp.AAC.1
MFCHDLGDCALTADQLAPLGDEHPNWPNLSAENHRLASLLTLAMNKSKGDWAYSTRHGSLCSSRLARWSWTRTRRRTT